MAVAVAVMLGLACLGLAFLPLLLSAGDAEAAPPADRLEILERERDRALDGIREVDLDLAMGKVTEKDHAALRARHETEAMTAIAALKELAQERDPASAADSEGGASEREEA